MPATSVSISNASAAPTASAPVALDWRGGTPVLWQVTISSSVATGDFTVQYTLDDISLTTYSSVYPRTGSPTAYPSTTTVWAAVSSTPYTTLSTTGSAGVHFTSSTIFPDGISGVFPASPAALRLYSSATSSGIITLKVIQADA